MLLNNLIDTQNLFEIMSLPMIFWIIVI